MKKHLSALVFLLAVLPTVVFADEFPKNLYTSLEMGAGIPNDTHLTFPNTGAKGTFSTDTDFAIAGSVGYHILPYLRIEGEIGHFGANLGSGHLVGVALSPTQASIDAMTYMVNAFYDWQNSSKFTPYVGFGIGAATVSSGTPSSYVIQSNSSDTVFAWQAALGSSYKITDNLSGVLGWRYIQAQDASLTASVPAFGASGVPMKTSFGTNEIRIGARWDF